ncbi:lysine N(6)-hydroxylase/L-ornithine N(5)-oxygenase family protein [Actinocorallia sp. API 0066]|uniref:lysine N(6)-hydroxylase/L-ornithine N(5)-oxygenase family protein n=1 Tax=Actinocorallia sp. API 0066 TaxID=2896846 RepID=UPI001E464D2B|nr:lysine N(6)-hydroxylase/L-ornithine N(5)-oxygenase family protein [Actinocorallia sp. API 0066]MCD0449948.1 lysine N(6)-hydroxylase/L-ornithine N(5)-oxygenase family protein [Actinocorallia sp. API 0066]
MSGAAEHVHDLVGIGFGPSNLALAIALREEGEGLDAVFLERQRAFGWHRGMLIEGTTMQVSFLKDLATMRNPSSSFSFLTYLKERDRLVDFINHKTMFPSRVEFHDYLEWAAARFADEVEYGTEVVAVRPVVEDGVVTACEVVARRDGVTVTRRARNLVVATGLEAVVPEGVALGERVWHSHELLRRLPELTAPRRLLVLGAGQSGAEVVDHLHQRFPESEVCAVFAKYGYTPADDSSFANRIFDPAAVDHFHYAPEDVKRMLLDYHGSTNYSVVDLDLIDELYRRVYQEKVQGKERLRVLNVSRITELTEHGDGVSAVVEFLPTGERTVLEADALVCATGYRSRDPLALLDGLAEHCARRPDGGVDLGRDYRVATAPEVRCGVYLQGATERTHGLSSTLLSNTAVRAGEIVQSLLRARKLVSV